MVGCEEVKLNVILTIAPDNFILEYCFGEDIALPYILILPGGKSLSGWDLELSISTLSHLN